MLLVYCFCTFSTFLGGGGDREIVPMILPRPSLKQSLNTRYEIRYADDLVVTCIFIQLHGRNQYAPQAIPLFGLIGDPIQIDSSTPV